MADHNSKMRSRSYIDLCNYEIERYLERNDIIIIPVGTVENHAELPVDCEGVAAEGWARIIAEKIDALVLPNVTYFNPGGTQSCRGTVHMSMPESYRYCLELAKSLLNQGFKRQIWMPAHAPSEDFLMPMIRQLFDDTKQSMLYLDLNAYFANMGLAPHHFVGKSEAVIPPAHFLDVACGMDDTMMAAYKVCGRLNAIPARDECDTIPLEPREEIKPWWEPYNRRLYKCSKVGTPAPFYYNTDADHVGPPWLKYTRKEIEEMADRGECYMQKMVDAGEFPELMEDLKELNEYMHTTVIPNHRDHLPKDRA